MNLSITFQRMGTVARLWLLVLTVSGCAGSENADGHQRMLTLLQQVKDRTPDENDYLGDLKARRYREMLSGPSRETNATRRLVAHIKLAEEELVLGNTNSAIENLVAAHQQFPGKDSEVFRNLNATGRTEFAKDYEALLLSLAVAYLRLAENENCVHCQGSESCVFPLRGKGVHLRQDATRKAIQYLTQLLKRNPHELTARWLLNIAAMAVGEYPDRVPEELRIPSEALESEEEFPRFVNVAGDLGLDTFNLSGGAVADDFDNDGWLDIVTSTWDPAGQMRFFRNNADGTFTDQTEQAGLIGLLGGLNMVQADFDNDGNLDVFVLRGAWLGDNGQHPNSLLRNLGGGRFRDVTFAAGLGNVHYPTQTAAWADYDNDGDLDLFVGNESFPSQLFENLGNGTFRDVAERAGVRNLRYTKGVVWGDYDGDRLPDLYVSNLEEENRLYHNNGNGTFTDVAPELGLTGPKESFPVWFWDFNNDGALDLYVSSYPHGVEYVAADYFGVAHKSKKDCLYQGNGRGRFREVASEQNLKRVTVPMGSNFGDADNDGFPDFYLGTGYSAYRGLMPNLFFRNRGGNGFSDVTTAGGFGHLQKGHAVAFADLDHDGDQDIFIQMGGAYHGDAFHNAMYENPGFGNHSITVRLVGRRSNRSAIGARVKVEFRDAGTKRTVYQWVNSGGSFGAKPFRREIGVGQATVVDRLEVFWPTSDLQQRFENIPIGHFVEITEGERTFRKWPRKPVAFKRPSR